MQAECLPPAPAQISIEVSEALSSRLLAPMGVAPPGVAQSRFSSVAEFSAAAHETQLPGGLLSAPEVSQHESSPLLAGRPVRSGTLTSQNG